MTFQIRKLTQDDADMFFDLRLESLQNSATSYLSTYDEEKELGKVHYIKEAISYAKNKIKCLTIELCVVEENKPAKNLFESCGFKAWGVEPMALCINDKFYNEIHMKLILKK